MIDVGFLKQLKAGAIDVRGNVECLTESGVVFAGGDEEPFDAVVAATGFRQGLERFLDMPDVVDERGDPRRSESGAGVVPGLFFCGYTETIRGQLLEARREAPKIAQAVSRYLRAV